jgi:hypothetical protein
MTLKEQKEEFLVWSSTTSAIIRQLALGGVAITWLFKSDGTALAVELGNALKLFIITIGLDLAHALIPTLLYGILNLILEKRHKGNEEAIVQYPGWITWPAWVFFCAKAVFLVLAYWAMYGYLQSASVIK